MDPFLILFIGVAIVIGMIIGLRINAFLALISAALVVSFLAPGELAEKVSRVASAFGGTAGGVGIVIALAAVIGKCLMDSGAADRIVQFFLKAMGEKRTAGALTGSGFILSIPVFFDTVFYLLIPLARSLYRSTKKNYLKYIMAISAGGAVTHSLVPPTPGPLLMAQQLDVDFGVMIGIGSLIGIPAAIAGLLFSSYMDKKMPIEMRALPGEEEEVEAPVTSGRKRPGLLLSLSPILLPVLLIAANTVLQTRANNERAAQVTAAQITNVDGLYASVAAAEEAPLASLRDVLPPQEGSTAEAIAAAMNAVLTDRDLFQTGANLTRSNLAIVEHVNRSAIEKALPEGILTAHEWETPNRKAANLSDLYGNANFALLVSAIIALMLFVVYRRPSKAEFSEALESSLMSGGLIILITAAGGAFGAMLSAAQIGPAIQEMFPTTAGEAGVGVGLLFLAFGISTLMKTAQGSTTVAVITASSMIAAMISGMELSFHPVYIATAIGGGGLVGSWMNDSGFWIFSKMSGLTEAEALKTWTPLLAILGITAFLTSVLLSLMLPLA